MASHCLERDPAEFDVRKDHGLELRLDRFGRKMFSRPEMAAPRIVDEDVEVAGFLQRSAKRWT